MEEKLILLQLFLSCLAGALVGRYIRFWVKKLISNIETAATIGVVSTILTSFLFSLPFNSTLYILLAYFTIFTIAFSIFWLASQDKIRLYYAFGLITSYDISFLIFWKLNLLILDGLPWQALSITLTSIAFLIGAIMVLVKSLRA